MNRKIKKNVKTLVMNTFKERISHFARQKYDAGWTNFEKLVGLSSGTIAKMGAYGLTMRQLAKGELYSY